MKPIAITIITGLVLAIGAPSALGHDVEIQNEIRVEANTGDNSTAPGENIQSGKSSASVKARTEVNGEVVEDIEREVTGTGNTEAKIGSKINLSSDRQPRLFLEKILNLFTRLQVFLLNLF